MSATATGPQATEYDDYLADGTAIRYTICTDDPATHHLFRADLGRRLRDAQVHIPASGGARRFARYRSLAPGGGASTDTYELPSGEVIVAIDAPDAGSHGYLRYHVEAAVAYTRALDVDVRCAGLLAAGLFALAAALFWLAGPLLAAPAVAAGGALVAPAAVNWLAARGRAVSVSRWDVPAER